MELAFFMNLSAKNLARKFFNRYFYRQHPEAALRYLPVVSAIKKWNLLNSQILEVGSGSLGITPYLKREIDAVGIDFSGPRTNLLNEIKGQADDLPFRKNSYDVVISVDVIEHLERDIREKAIYEILRVAKKIAVIAVPTGELAQNQDKQLQKYWRKVFDRENHFLEEHIRNGLPTSDEILVYLDKSLRKLGKNAKITSTGNLNLAIRNILMRTWITRSKLLYYLYLKGYLLLIPILKFANFGNCYRRVFVIEFDA